MQRVTPQQAHELMRDRGYVYLDVRSVPEFDAGHPEGAYNVPWQEHSSEGMRPNAAFLAEVRAAFDLTTKMVVGCKGVTRAEQAAGCLNEAGFVDLVLQGAGMDGLTDAFGRVTEPGWQKAGLPLGFLTKPGHSHAELKSKAR